MTLEQRHHHPTVEQLANALASGRTTALQLAEAALARAEDPAGEGARVFIRLDRERALAQARASDQLRAAGIVRSPLEGVPVSVDGEPVADVAELAGLLALHQPGDVVVIVVTCPDGTQIEVDVHLAPPKPSL